jgi:pimeloyl-ACP methyl ester carboxylesterase
MPPTIVLVHGAFAESASWNGVARRLHAAGHPVVAAANPLRGVADDAAAISDLIRTIDGPVVLVGHSYRFHDQFCADLPAAEAGLMAATQRPVAQAALEEQAGPDPLWKRVPSSFLIGGEDRNIPAALQRSLAERADAQRTVEIPGASHAVAVSHPDETADLVLEAARAGAAA